MSDSPPQRRAVSRLPAPLVVMVGVVVAVGAWMLPVNLKSMSPALLEAAGHGTPTLGAYGRDLVDGEKIGPAALVLSAAKAVNDPRAPNLEEEIQKFARRSPGVMAWGGWDP